VSVGSASNVGDRMGKLDPASLAKWTSQHPLGAAWGNEEERADVLVFDPDGGHRRIYATGIRNCVGMAVAPSTGTLWCSTNERDGLGDNVPPDYITRVRQGAFYGWPWYYIGAHQDPRHDSERPDLKDKITVPDVLIQPHSASLGLAFYDATQFPAQYRGNIFAAEHGSWNRSKRTGYKVIRVPVKDGAPTGEYEDFVTGFVIDDADVWGRPVGVAVDKDGALLVSEDASGTIWRITYSGRAAQAQ
jgi:glucose/arabinose dehydrogenase